MKNKILISFLLGLIGGLFSCASDDAEVAAPVTDTEVVLKAVAEFPIGMAVNYAAFLNDAAYREIVAREANSTTFEYSMKHGALVKDNGTLDFSSADALYEAATAADLEVFGHTLAWHTNQNANYLNSVVGGAGNEDAVNILPNNGFEEGEGDNFTGWAVYNAENGATITAGTAEGEVYAGVRSLKIVNPQDHEGDQWRVQVASPAVPTTVGTRYSISCWIKSAAANGSGRLSTQPTAQYQADFTTSTAWQQITWSITAQDPETRIMFDMGAKANTYFIDDVKVSEITQAGGDAAGLVDNALKDFITKTVSHYKGKVKAWDVVNEAISDGGELRTSANTSVPSGATDHFFWSDYLGSDWALKAFQYAADADPEALLFINDYNLEYSATKLDALIAYVTALREKGAKIDGIGTQMHISINTSQAAIDGMFRKLAATGLLVRVSELDVRANPGDQPNFDPATDQDALSKQAAMYKYVFESYMEHVPAAQRHGITIWGVTDNYSWIVLYQERQDAPLLFDEKYKKKPAFTAVVEALRNGK